MDINDLEVPEVPIPARILEERARALRNQRSILRSAKARRRKVTTDKKIKRKAS